MSCSADGLFERRIILSIPSYLAASDHDDVILAFEKVMHAVRTRLSRGDRDG